MTHDFCDLEQTLGKMFDSRTRGGLYGFVYNTQKNPDCFLAVLKHLEQRISSALVVSLDVSYEELLNKIKQYHISQQKLHFVVCSGTSSKCTLIRQKGSLPELSEKLRTVGGQKKTNMIFFISPEKLLLLNSSIIVKNFFHYYAQNLAHSNTIGITLFEDSDTTSSLLPHIREEFTRITFV